MMLSEWKGFLWTCALVTGAAIVLSVALSIRLLFGGSVSPRFELTVMSLFFLTFLCWLPAVILMTEYTKAAREGVTGLQRASGLSGREISSLTRHCPGPLKIVSVVGIVLGSLQLFRIGEASVALGPGLSTAELRGMLAGATVFLCIAFPVLTSAARMEGGYGD
jgi:hypothetical protein